MSSIKNLVSQTAIYGISATLGKFINFFLTPYLTRIMGDSVYGEVSYYYALIPFANVLLTMGMATGLFRFIDRAQGDQERRKLFMTLWISVSALTILLCGGMSLVVSNPVWLITLALIAVDNISALPLSSLRADGRAAQYTVVNLAGILVNVGLCITFYEMIPNAAQSPYWVILANFVASSVSLVLLVPSIRRYFAITFSLEVFKTVAKYSLPLMAAGVLGVSSDFIDRQMLVWLLPSNEGFSQVGLYGSVAKLASLMIIFRQIYSLGAEPFFLKKFSREDFARLNAASMKYFTIAGLFIFLVICLFADLFGLILGKGFRVGLDILPLLLLANLLSGLLINLSLWYKVADMTRIAIWVTLTGLVLTVATNWVLIPIMGYQGSAIARVVATLSTVVVCWAFGRRYYPIKYDLRRIGLYFLVAGSIFALSLTTSTFDTIWRWSANFLLLLSFLLFANYKEKLWPVKSK